MKDLNGEIFRNTVKPYYVLARIVYNFRIPKKKMKFNEKSEKLKISLKGAKILKPLLIT